MLLELVNELAAQSATQTRAAGAGAKRSRGKLYVYGFWSSLGRFLASYRPANLRAPQQVRCGLGGWLALLLAAGLWPGAPAGGQDTVTIITEAGVETRLSGRVVEYLGGELRLMLPGGRQRSIPAAQVLAVETQYTASYAAAEEAFAEHRFEQALTLYRQALEEEPRRWVRRQTLARMVWCYQTLDRWGEAGEAFLLLVQSDPQTPQFDCIPLAWVASLPSPALEQAARNWLARPEPAAVLLGASHLLTTAARAQALAQLARLATGQDRRIALLAAAQQWRAQVPTATADQLAAWQRVVEQIPENLQAGPALVLGSAWLNQRNYEQAALWLLRAPILDPRHRTLAARGLVDAGRALEQLGKRHEAGRLYAEVVRDYPEQSRAVAEARARAEALQGQPPAGPAPAGSFSPQSTGAGNLQGQPPTGPAPAAPSQVLPLSAQR